VTGWSKKEWTFYLATTAATIALVYLVSTENVDLKVLRGVSIACQSTARIVGTWGLNAECAYNTILEQGRMV
jgi:hypothetical protein